MVRRPFFRIALLLAIFWLCLSPPLRAHSQQDSLLHLQQQQAQQQRLDSLEEKIEQAATTLTIARQYSQNADKLTASFLSWMKVLLATVSIVFVLLGFGGIVGIYNWTKSRYQKALAKALETLQKEADEKIHQATQQMERQFQRRITDLDHSIRGHQRDINNLLRTESRDRYLRQSAALLFIHKAGSSSESRQFRDLQKVLVRQFGHCESITLGQLQDIAESPDFAAFLKKTAHPKIALMNDELFEPLLEGQGRQRSLSDEGRQIVQTLFDPLAEHKIGFLNFGQLPRRDLAQLPYKAFANEAYSLYTNCHQLLHYLYAEQSQNP
ncbi:MAG: hypothetical protein AAFV95_28475 [Bacteroidota bacterium]